MPKNVLHKLSTYRLDVNDIASVDVPSFNEVAATTRRIGAETFPYRLLFHQGHARDASWFAAFEHLPLTVKGVPRTMNAGFVLLVEVGKSCYAVTGGVGHLHLRKTVEVSYQFGVELAKRILSEDELRSLAQRDTGGNVNAIDRHFRARYSPRRDVNNLRRILKNVRGQLSKAKNTLTKTIGSSIQGTDALTVNGEKSFDDTLKFLAEVERLWQKGKDRIVIPSLERLDPRAHAALIDSLRTVLIQGLCAYDEDGPQGLFIEGESRDVFNDETTKWTLRRDRWKQEANSAGEMLGHIRDRLAAVKAGQERNDEFDALKLHIEYDDGASEDHELLRFICGDVVLKNESYFLDHRSWYRASSAYVKALARQVDEVECIDAKVLALNDWDKKAYKNEDQFNASHAKYVLLDKRLVTVTGQTGIEFCDLLGQQGARTYLIHVKEANGAKLRELFAQGAVSGELYANDDAFRKLVHTATLTLRTDVPALSNKDKATLAGLAAKRRSDMVVIYAILDRTASHVVAPGAKTTSQVLDGTLSTFAKVDLLNRCQELRSNGFGVAVARIRPFPAAKAKKRKSP